MIRFSNVNNANSENYNPNYQRHHLIPVQAVSEPKLRRTFKALSDHGFNLNDFGQNGILLPCNEREAAKTGRPLHRGPHPRYSKMVIGRLLRISQLGDEIQSNSSRQNFLCYRTTLLQRSLHRGLAHGGFVRLRLNSRDPLTSNVNFDKIDAQIDRLYPKPNHKAKQSILL